MRNKHFLDRGVATTLGLKKITVSRITNLFLSEIKQALVDTGQVRLEGLGSIRVDICPTNSKKNLKYGDNTP